MCAFDGVCEAWDVPGNSVWITVIFFKGGASQACELVPGWWMIIHYILWEFLETFLKRWMFPSYTERF